MTIINDFENINLVEFLSNFQKYIHMNSPSSFPHSIGSKYAVSSRPRYTLKLKTKSYFCQWYYLSLFNEI